VTGKTGRLRKTAGEGQYEQGLKFKESCARSPIGREDQKQKKRKKDGASQPEMNLLPQSIYSKGTKKAGNSARAAATVNTLAADKGERNPKG